MSAAAVAMAGLALLFVAFGVLAPADGREGGGGCGGGGDCGSCTGGGTCAAGTTSEPTTEGGAP